MPTTTLDVEHEFRAIEIAPLVNRRLRIIALSGARR
jgi:hypothetical protein